MSAVERPVSRGAKALAIALALLPAARMAWIVFTYGENNLSNDYAYRVPLVADLLEGRSSPSDVFQGTFIGGGHSWLGLLPFYWLDARFFAWDLHVELGIGLFLAALKTLLVWLAVGASLPARARWALLPILSALAFSVSQVSTFTFGESVLQMQLSQIGLALGALAMARLAARPGLRVVALAGGGLLASWSWGGGVMTWPVFAAALLLSGERALRRWAVLAAGAALGLSQYVWLLVLRPPAGPPAGPGLSRPWRVLDLLGRPFANGTGREFGLLPAAIAFGAAGLVLGTLVLAALGRGIRERLPSAMIVGWSLLAALQISLFREGIAPWYAAPMTAFWLGLAGLFAAAPRTLRSAGFATILLGFLFSNRTWEDKSFYLASRAPVSAACLREWRTAPPECHHAVFQWGDEGRLGELARLAEPLERHGLSVFGPRRTYLLQGDIGRGRVGLEPMSSTSFFSRDGVVPADPNDFHRLDLVLAPGATATWRVDVPANIRLARFASAVRAQPNGLHAGRYARFTVVSKDVHLQEHVFLEKGARRSVSLDLARFAGQSIRLEIHSEDAKAPAAPLLFEAPRIEMQVAAGGNPGRNP